MLGKIWLLVSLLGGLFLDVGSTQAQVTRYRDLPRSLSFWGEGTQTNDCYSPDPATAVEGCTAIIGSWPKDARGWMDRERTDAFNNRGVAYDRLGQMDRALADFEEALRVDPKNPFAFVNRAHIRLVQGDYNGALADYNRALGSYNLVYYHTQGGWPWRTGTTRVFLDALPGRADTYVKLGQIDRAITDYNRAITENNRVGIYCYPAALIGRKNASILNSRGSAYAKKNDYERAIADFSRAIEIAPDPIVFANRGVAYVKARQYGVAIRDLDEALKVNADDAVALYHRGVARQNVGDAQGGTDDIVRARQIDPTIDP